MMDLLLRTFVNNDKVFSLKIASCMVTNYVRMKIVVKDLTVVKYLKCVILINVGHLTPDIVTSNKSSKIGMDYVLSLIHI